MSGAIHARARPGRRFIALGLFALVLAALVATAPRRLIGDGPEYLALARATLSGGGNAFASAVHFWMYPALAAPFVHVSASLGLTDSWGFVLLNVVLLLTAFWLVSKNAGLVAAALVLLGPVIWWVDKPHTEVFTVALLSIALALKASPWSPIAVGLAATQNPPVAVLLPLLLIDWLLQRGDRATPGEARPRRSSVMWLGFASGIGLAVLPVVYYRVTRGVLSPLLETGQRQTPTLREVLAVVADPNLGVLFGYPILPVLAVALAGVLLERIGPRRLVRLARVPAIAAACFLWAFANVTNFNHGATPGMSRYALWLIPLTIPLLRGLHETTERSPRWLLALTGVSVAWSLVFFRPALPEAVGTPSAPAAMLWHRYPAFDNPLPEVFVERNSGRETTSVPVAEPGCAKVLLMGGGEQAGEWPVPCPPAPVPQECTRPGTLCYANRNGTSFRFVRITPRAYHAFRLENDVWPREVPASLASLLEQDAWREARIVSPGDPGVMVRAVHLARRAHVLQAPDRLFVYLVQPRAGAALDLRLPVPMQGELLGLRDGRPLSEVRLPAASSVQSVPLPASSDAVVFLAVASGR